MVWQHLVGPEGERLSLLLVAEVARYLRSDGPRFGSDAVRYSNCLGYRAEEMGMKVQWPRQIMVDNAAAVSFQSVRKRTTWRPVSVDK